MVTMLTESGEWALPDARVAGDALWLPLRDAEAATGWEARPEGFCRGETCVPLPRGREQEILHGGSVDVAALWRHLGQPVVRSAQGHAWVLARSGHDRAAALHSLEAPDFTLPDLSGRLHSLSDERGRKVLLVTWASW
jgi:hypothetical protein